MKHNLHAIREGTMKVVFLLTACISILAVALICIFLFANGIPPPCIRSASANSCSA